MIGQIKWETTGFVLSSGSEFQNALLQVSFSLISRTSVHIHKLFPIITLSFPMISLCFLINLWLSTFPNLMDHFLQCLKTARGLSELR